jgi:hypothetical protein
VPAAVFERVVRPRTLLARRALLPAAVLARTLLPGVGHAHGPSPAVELPGVVTECEDDVRLFRSLASGTVDYCRGHLRYVPGALDCFRVVDRVCSVFLPATAEWTDTRLPRVRIPFACPDAPEPPVCRRLDIR